MEQILMFFGYENMVEYRGVYSILGAAAMTSSVTRTISVAMIVLELNGHLSHAVPLMVCVLSSYATSEYLKPQSFFEMLAEFSGLTLKTTQKDQIIVKDLLELDPKYRKMEYLSLRESTYNDMIRLVKLYCTN